MDVRWPVKAERKCAMDKISISKEAYAEFLAFKAAKATTLTPTKISPDIFVVRAVERLRKDGYKGIHTVISGLNIAIKKYYGDVDPVEVVNALIRKGIVEGRPCKKGFMIYKKGEMPKGSGWDKKSEDTLKAILS